MPTQQILMGGTANVTEGPGGTVAIVWQDPAGNSVVLGLGDEAAETIGKDLLKRKVHVAGAHEMPNGKPPGPVTQRRPQG